MHFFKKIHIFLLIQAIGSCAFAQVSGDPSNPSTIGYSKKNSDSVSKWTYAGSASANRGLDYFEKVYTTYSLAAVYNLDEKQILSTNIFYSIPADGLVDFKEDWGFEDLTLAYTRKKTLNIIENSPSSLRLEATAPTSATSKRAGLLGSISASLPTSLSWGKNYFVIAPSLRVSRHTYETADLEGTRQNSPLSMSLSLLMGRPLLKNLSGNIMLGYTNLADYEYRFQQIQSIGLSFTQTIYNSISLTGGYSWRDRRISNNAVFDDDRSSYFLSLNFIL